MKKGIQYLIVILIASFLLIGCGPATPSPEGPSVPTQVPEEPTSPPPEPTEPPPAPEEAAPLRVAVLLPGTVDDMSFNQQMYEGLMRVKEHLGDQVEVAYSENLYQAADIEPALRDFASQGFDLILGHSFSFQDPIMAVAPDYPEVHFAIGTGGYLTADNVSDYDADNAQEGYLQGIVAGLITKANVIGSIGAMQIPNLITKHGAFDIAVKSVNPDAEVLLVYTGAFGDVEAAREAALSMIDQGADVIYSNAADEGPLKAAGDRGVYHMTSADLSSLGPEVFVCSVPEYWDVVIEEMLEDIEEGDFGGKKYVLNLQNGGLDLRIHLSDLVADVQDQIDEVVAGLKDGSIEIPEIPLE